MPYIIHNCVYKVIDAVKGQWTQKHHDTKKTINEIKKRFSGKKKKKKKNNRKTRLYMKMELKDKA